MKEGRGYEMLYSEAKKEAAGILLSAGIDEAQVDAEYLLQEAAGVDRSSLFMMLSEVIPQDVEKKYRELIKRRSSHEPLQYILGNQDFMGYTFIVTPDVLIPRFDTEILAEHSIRRAEELLEGIKDRVRKDSVNDDPESNVGDMPENTKHKDTSDAKFRYLDLCTGSGCVATSVGLEIRKRYFGTDIEILGADISEAAVELARKNWNLNYQKNHSGSMFMSNLEMQLKKSGQISNLDTVKATFIKSDLFEALEGKFDIITANPPYIVRDEIDTLMPEIQEHEPHIALDGGTDGMDFYRRICMEAPGFLKKGGRLLMEFDDSQAEPVARMMEAAGFKEIEVHRDLAGLRRVIEGIAEHT